MNKTTTESIFFGLKHACMTDMFTTGGGGLTIGHIAVICQSKEDACDHLSDNSQDNAPKMYHYMGKCRSS